MLAFQTHDDMEFGVVMVVVVIMRMLMIVVVMVAMLVVVMVVMIVIMRMIVLIMIMAVIVVLVIMIVPIRAEAMRVGIDTGDFTATPGISVHPLGRAQERQGSVQRGLLLIIARGVLKTDQVNAGNFQLQANITVIHGQVAGGNTMHMGGVLALNLSQGAAGQQGRRDCCNEKRTSLHACTPC